MLLPPTLIPLNNAMYVSISVSAGFWEVDGEIFQQQQENPNDKRGDFRPSALGRWGRRFEATIIIERFVL